MQGHLQPIPENSYLLRVGDDNWRYGDPYQLCLVVTDMKDGTCYLSGLDVPITVSIYRFLQLFLSGYGWKEAIWERRKGEKVRVQTEHAIENPVLTDLPKPAPIVDD